MSKRKVPAASPLMEALDDLEMTEDEEEIADQPTLKGPTSAKKSGYYVDHVAVINESTGAKKKRGRRLAETPEASRMYGEAMELFADGKVDEAKTKLQGVIADQPNMAEAYKSLALVHEQLDENHEAAVNYEIAGEKLKEAYSFARAAKLFHMLGDATRAFNCYGKAAKYSTVDDPEANQRRAALLLEQNPPQPRKAVAELAAARERSPRDLEILKEMARVYDSYLGEYANALHALSDAFVIMTSDMETHGSNLVRATVDLRLIVLYSKALIRAKEWEKVLSVVEFAERKRGMAPLPLELTFMSAIARVRSGHGPEKFRTQISYLLESNPSEWHAQLYELAEAFSAVGLYNDAISVLEHIQTSPELDGSMVWARLADANYKLGALPRAVHFWDLCFQEDKTNVEACLALSQIYDELGQIDKGIAVVSELERATGSSLSAQRNTSANSGPSSSSAMAISGHMGEEAHVESTFETTSRAYVEKETRIKVAVAKARLFFQKGDYAEFIELLRPILSSQEILFYRKKRRIKRKPTETDPEIASAAVRRQRTKGRKSETPFEGSIGGGISTVGVAAPVEADEINEEDFQVEHDELPDEEIEEILPVAPPRRGRPPGSGKKRKHAEIEPSSASSPSSIQDPLGDAEMVTYEAGRQGWALPNEARLKEMQSRRNLWELFGMKEFTLILGDFCKCIVFLKCATMELYRIIETAFALVMDEADIILVPGNIRADLRFQVAQVAYEVQLYGVATQMMRVVCHSNPNNAHTWNFFFKGVSRTREFYVSRSFTNRLVAKNPDCVPLQLLTGHLSQMAGSYQYAIASYLKAYSIDQSLPSTLLCAAVSHISRSMSRSNPNRNSCVLKAFAFFYRYFFENVWGVGACKHEAYYNLARAFHHLSLYHYAIPLYQEVLKEKNLPDTVYDAEMDQVVGHLQREAAYNLALIYRASGAHHLARRMLQNYLTV